MNWSRVLELIARVAAEQGEARRIRLVLADASYHVKEVLSQRTPGEGELLGFVVFEDDPDASLRSDASFLLFLRPEQVLRVEVQGDHAEREESFGF